jgi:pSer/pThr/pTyr-binding forkhead associated (FHA) protein
MNNNDSRSCAALGVDMAKLILALDGALLGEYPIDKKYVTIGRRPINDIQIDNLAVSGEHARIITVGEDSTFEDLDSTNGSFVQGKKINKQLLRAGDVVTMGKYSLTYVSDAPAHAAKSDDFENTIMIAPPSGEASSRQEAVGQAATAAATDTPPAARVQILNGPATGKELLLTKTLTTLGKAGGQVAVITRRPQGYFLTHVEGDSSPGINGQSIGLQAHQLQDHDVIEVAGVKMEFYLE